MHCLSQSVRCNSCSYLYSRTFCLLLLEKMDLTNHHADSEDRETVAARHFARFVHDQWGVGVVTDCGGTGALIFLSTQNRAAYISRGGALDTILTDRRIEDVIEAMRPHLRENEFDKAIIAGIERIDHYLTLGADDADDSLFSRETMIGIAVFGSFVAFALFKGRQERIRRQHVTTVSRYLSSIDQQRAQALQGQFKTTSCPICLEDFSNLSSTPPKGSDGLNVILLRCGHAFDQKCWDEWAQTDRGQVRCPICREEAVSTVFLHRPVRDRRIPASRTTEISTMTTATTSDEDRNEELGSTADTFPDWGLRERSRGGSSTITRSVERQQHQFTLERNFRLNQLERMYPNIILPETIDRWTDIAFDESLASDLARQEQQRVRTTLDSNSRGSGSFGGGRSSGGGGGRW